MDKLTLQQLQQLLSYAQHYEETGCYYGNPKHFINRHAQILEWLTKEIKAEIERLIPGH